MAELKWLLKFADKLSYLSIFPVHTKYWGVLNGERDRRSRRGWYVKRAGGSLRSLILVVVFILSMRMLQFDSFK